MLKKFFLSIVVIAIISSCSRIYAEISDNDTIKKKVDNIVVKIQNNMFDKEDPKVFKEDINELSSLGEAAVPYLLDRIKEKCQKVKNPESLVWALAVEGYSLSKIGRPATPYLIEALEDKSAEDMLRWLAIDLISVAEDERAIEPLIKVVTDRDESITLRRRAAYALRFFRNQKCVDALIEVLDEDDQLLKARAVTALGFIGNKNATQYIIKMLTPEDEIVPRFAAEALGRIGDKSAVEPLIPLLSDDDWVVRSQAAKALGQLKDPRATEPLRKALKDSHAWVKREAMIALGMLGDEEGFRMLIDTLKTSAPGYLWPIIKALGEIGNKEAIEPLKEQLHPIKGTPHQTTTAFIVLSLAKLGSQDGFDEAVECLDTPDTTTIIAAIRALGEMGNESAIEPLTKHLDSINAEVQKEAEKAIKKLRSKEK